MQFRTERDLLGEREVPSEALFGIHTLRAIENFRLTGRPIHPQLIAALAKVKMAAASTNGELGLLAADRVHAITQACAEIATGRWIDQFPVDALQGGAGTSSNMNANEVIANRAIEILGGEHGDYALVHPLDHVNMNQSTNDVFPTAVRIAAIGLLRRVSEELSRLQAALQAKEAEFATVVKLGRTELQDALPVMLGQEFGAYAQAIARDRWRTYKVEERLREVNIGGTAVGTGANADRRYIYLVIERLRDVTGFGLARAEYMMDVTQNSDVFVEVSGIVKASAVNLVKIAGDLRLMSSGPAGGLGEIRLPALQAGSSIMPGKVNPVVPEAVRQTAYQIMACDMAITLGAQGGELELNANLPLIAANLLSALDLLAGAVQMLVDRCVPGIEADLGRCRAHLEASYVFATALAPSLGYDVAAGIAKEACETGRTVRQVALDKGVLGECMLDRILDPYALTTPGIPGQR